MEFIFTLEHIAKSIPLSIFEDDDFLSAFRSEWLDFFNKRFRDIVPIDFLKSTMMLRGCVANIPKAATRTYLRAKLSC